MKAVLLCRLGHRNHGGSRRKDILLCWLRVLLSRLGILLCWLRELLSWLVILLRWLHELLRWLGLLIHRRLRHGLLVHHRLWCCHLRRPDIRSLLRGLIEVVDALFIGTLEPTVAHVSDNLALAGHCAARGRLPLGS